MKILNKIIEENLEGGKADNLKLTDIAKKHKISLDKLKKEMYIGIKVELEHTTEKDVAIEITLDHLFEFPDYYTRLLDMEAEAKKELK